MRSRRRRQVAAERYGNADEAGKYVDGFKLPCLGKWYEGY